MKLFQFYHWHREKTKKVCNRLCLTWKCMRDISLQQTASRGNAWGTSHYNRLCLTWKCMRDISLQQTVPHMEMHEGHLITTDCASRENAWGTSHYNRLCLTWKCMRDISVFPFSTAGSWGVPTVSPGPLLSHSFSHWNGIPPPQWNIATITPDVFSYWNGTSPQCKHTQYFQPLEWNITVTPTALTTGMEHHHSYTLSAANHWNGTSQLHPLLSPTGMEH